MNENYEQTVNFVWFRFFFLALSNGEMTIFSIRNGAHMLWLSQYFASGRTLLIKMSHEGFNSGKLQESLIWIECLSAHNKIAFAANCVHYSDSQFGRLCVTVKSRRYLFTCLLLRTRHTHTHTTIRGAQHIRWLEPLSHTHCNKILLALLEAIANAIIIKVFSRKCYTTANDTRSALRLWLLR